MMIAVWSAVSFVGLWLLLLAFTWLVGVSIRRLEKDDGPWRRGL